MESNPDPTYISIRIEPEGMRERRDALKLKACPFCGGTVDLSGDTIDSEA